MRRAEDPSPSPGGRVGSGGSRQGDPHRSRTKPSESQLPVRFCTSQPLLVSLCLPLCTEVTPDTRLPFSTIQFPLIANPKGTRKPALDLRRTTLDFTSFVIVVQWLGYVRLFVTPWTAAGRLPCPSPSPRACSNPRPLSQWCPPTISSSVVPFFSGPQSFPASGSFPMSRLFASGSQSIGVSALASVLPKNIPG